ncbi:MAG: MoxR-like ATPase [Candidatus Nanosalina sp. J07AB43]|nr:MAG: MoxR-like ATPase [Candidatus Nanosalina sp. J07AB43]
MSSKYDDYSDEQLSETAEMFSEKAQSMESQIQNGFIGQEDVIRKVLLTVIGGGNVLLEGVPGLGKSLLVTLLSETVKAEGDEDEAEQNRIQFTPDLLPSDIVGVEAYNEDKGFYVEKGPIFSNFILADEINRAPPKVQSAMLEAMQEHKVSIGDETFHLPEPFFVMATQNPTEQGGTYPLPEAQIDRFMFKIYLDYPRKVNERKIIDMNANIMDDEDFGVHAVVSKSDITGMQEFSKHVRISEEVKAYIVDLVDASRSPAEYGLEYDEFIEWGCTPRASINLALAGRSHALFRGRHYVTPEDIREVIKDVFIHRIMLNYEGEARDIEVIDIIHDIVDNVPVR